MLGQKLTVNICGDYIESYIYSGVLFLIDADFKLSIYSWDKICEELLANKTLFEKLKFKRYLLGHSSSIVLKHQEIFEVTENDIKKHKLHELNINEWPSDISIYNNRFYFSSSNGVSYFDFYWENGSIDGVSKINKIIDAASFKLAPGSHNRIAVAAGNDGVLSVAPERKYINDKDVKSIITEPCNNLDWLGNRLIANTKSGIKFVNYEPLIKQSEFNGTEKEFWAKIVELKQQKPSIETVKKIGEADVLSSIYLGDKILYIDSGNNVLNRAGEILTTIDIPNNNQELYFSSSVFGVIAESINDLYLVNSSGISKLDDKFANYRSFPRAKFYANQLHVVNDEHLSVKIFSSNSEDKFSYNVKEITAS
ncbi:hypothetical protein [Psychromonas sp. L1A2]|uniref:hypothetical protein n=1 Tax=Psychromonas sp. L1A2 TaxID=2686356 RepID=UPI00135921CF|nr:hypothetical protein [Psychromonas sp. L1A2]